MDRLHADRIFVAVMEEGSFVGAARRLGTSPPQASKLVARLEAALGVRLLDRTTRAISPTEAGRAYYDRLKPLLDELESLDLAVRDISREPRGRLRLSVPLTFGTLELTAALNDFALRYPEIALDVSFSDRMVSLVDEGFDLAVRIGQPQDTSLIARKLTEVRPLVVASEDYLARHGTPETPDDLRRHVCILDTNMREPTRWRFLAPEGEPVTVEVGGRIRYSNADACIQAAEAGLGVAFLPGFVAGPAVAEGRVRRLLPEFGSPPLVAHALYPHSRHLAAKVLPRRAVSRHSGLGALANCFRPGSNPFPRAAIIIRTRWVHLCRRSGAAPAPPEQKGPDR